MLGEFNGFFITKQIEKPWLFCTVLYCTVLYFTVLYCTVLYCTVLYWAVLYWGMRDKPIEISQGSLVSLCVAVPPPPKVGGERRVRLSTEHYQSFFINATSKLVTKLQATRDWLIQHSNRISKLSCLSWQMEMLAWSGIFDETFQSCSFLWL